MKMSVKSPSSTVASSDNPVLTAYLVAQLARMKGLAVACKAGKLQLQTVTYDRRGRSTVTPRSEWLIPAEALKAVS